MPPKTFRLSFGFEWEGQFVSGTIHRKENGKRDAYLIVGEKEYETIHDFLPAPEEQKKFIARLKKHIGEF
jgi:hypothetical protein